MPEVLRNYNIHGASTFRSRGAQGFRALERVRIATRRSRLAVAQADAVARQLRRMDARLGTERVEITTRGDESAAAGDQPVQGKGSFIEALERALLDGRADIAVHSMKDVPAALPEHFALATFGARADVRDALVTRAGGAALGDLPAGARLGTSSTRRGALLAMLDRGLEVVPLRGNVDTRLRRLDAGDFDALLLACAGLDRLGLHSRIDQRIDVDALAPAPGQGAIAVEHRAERRDLGRLIAHGTNDVVQRCVAAERRLTLRLGADCAMPLGAVCTPVDAAGATLRLIAALADAAGERLLRVEVGGADPLALGDEAARRLEVLGAAGLLNR